jgi:hypothetical protein
MIAFVGAPKRVDVVGPPTHHPNPLLPKLATLIGCPDLVSLDMRKLAFDGVRVPLAASLRSVLAVARKPWAVAWSLE